MQLSLTNIEKEVLFKKKIAQGKSILEADYEIKRLIKNLKDLTFRLKKRKNETRNIHQIFREEYAKLIDR